jgi:hypothetical protein
MPLASPWGSTSLIGGFWYLFKVELVQHLGDFGWRPFDKIVINDSVHHFVGEDYKGKVFNLLIDGVEAAKSIIVSLSLWIWHNNCCIKDYNFFLFSH